MKTIKHNFMGIGAILFLASSTLTFAGCQESDTDMDSSPEVLPTNSYPIVSTSQAKCYNAHNEMAAPLANEPFYGQDAQYQQNPVNYTDHGDGTITDEVTGLMWQKDPGLKMTYAEAVTGAQRSDPKTGSHTDYPYGHGPQGDAIRILNKVRLVRWGN